MRTGTPSGLGPTRAPAVVVARDRRGVALMLALWVLLVLGVASLQVLSEVRARVDVAALARSRTVARYAAESGVLAAQTLLDDMIRAANSSAEQAEVFDAFRRTVEAWGERPIGSGRYQVVVEDLGSRVDLNESRVEVVQGLLRQFVSDAEAANLVRALRGWAEEDEEEAVDLAGGAPVQGQGIDPSFDEPITDRPLMHLEELLLVPGFSDYLAAAVAPYVTVWGEGRINANTAPVPVLAAVPGIGEVAAQSLVAAREQDGALASGVAVYSHLAESTGGTLSSRMPDLVTVPRRVLIVSRGWEEGRPYTHEVQAVFDVLASRLLTTSRVRPRFWTERGR